MRRELSRAAPWMLLSALLMAACSRSPPQPVGHTEITAGTADMPGPVTPEDKERLRRAEEAATKDLQITTELQKRLDNDEWLSRKAKTITIITVDGKVTLRGSVANAEEAAAIADKAKTLPNVIAVENLLEYPPSEL